MSANVGLAIQCVGIVLVALLSVSIRDSIKSARRELLGDRLDVSLPFTGESVYRASVASEQKLFFCSLLFSASMPSDLIVYRGLPSFRDRDALCPASDFRSRTWPDRGRRFPFSSADFNDLFMVHATIFAASCLPSRSWRCARRSGLQEQPRIASHARRPGSAGDRFSALRARVCRAQRALGIHGARPRTFNTHRSSI